MQEDDFDDDYEGSEDPECHWCRGDGWTPIPTTFYRAHIAKESNDHEQTKTNCTSCGS